MFIPLTALRRSADGTQVFKIAEVDGKLRAKVQQVVTGPVDGEEIVILDGLAAGEPIATVGSFKLREGALVLGDVPPPAAQPPPTTN